MFGKILGKVFGGKEGTKDLLEKADELHLSKEEKLKLGLEYLEALAPFKIVQRIIVFCVMAVWLIISLSLIGAIWFDASEVYARLIELIKLEFIAYPSVGVFSLYLLGGVIPQRK
jgi:hypothetical protein